MNSVITDNFTPMMKQYNEAKAQVPGKLLFFRMGDFYELFLDDALKAAPIMGIALTSRDKKNPIPMCGVPYHAVSSYISKLTQKGLSVAICEQMEDPKMAKGIVKREIIRVITPSLVYDSNVIEGKQTSYLVSLVFDEGKWSYACLDYTTGEFKANTVNSTDELVKEVALIAPREVIYEKEVHIPEVLKRFLLNVSFSSLEPKSLSNINFNQMIVDTRLGKHEVKAGKLIINYLVDTQFRDSFPHIRYFYKVSSSEFLGIDEFTSKNLDLFNSFLGCLDETITPMGGRMLRQTIGQPLKDEKAINNRLDAVETLTKNYNTLEKIRLLFTQCSDIERLSSKVALGQFGPRDFKRLLDSIEVVASVKESTADLNLKIKDIDIKDLYDFASELSVKFEDELPFISKEGGIFKHGFDHELDELIDLHSNSKQVLLEMERSEKERTKISSLKIKYNKVFGYYIEITNANLHLVPENYQRKQTLVNGERFMTPELRELEIKLLNAEENRVQLEEKRINDFALQFKEKFLSRALDLSLWAAEIDTIANFAWLAIKRKYTRPDIYKGFDLVLKDAKHPVLDQTMGDEFIPNDISLNSECFFHIITGPNMAGKSTLMRTVALLVIMSHMGSFIPASYASIPVVDRVFTRVGATDYILQGQSTFMVEMIETSNIIYSATKDSLIILDEIGRGTSTYDGISIAWAIAEYIHNKIGAKCMFATHYHELTILEQELSGARNFSMSVEEEKDGLFFLRKIIQKPASRSYGIQVASMAGLPDSVIKRAYHIMRKLEEERARGVDLKDTDQLSLFTKISQDNEPAKNDVTAQEKNNFEFIDELAKIDLNKITPLDALSKLYKWKEEVDKVEQ
ncbi:MAG: DNA mismatch repair protein MutS [Proteobacteria bacterium]|nr:DNA mismatch repair protein MutS [Pseudomonadota bacterium]